VELAVVVQQGQGAEPTLLLASELERQGASVARKAADGAALAVARSSAIMRVVPRPVWDDSADEENRAVYTVTWAIPRVCQAAPPLRLPADREEANELWRLCRSCGEDFGLVGKSPNLLPSGPHLTWWDVTAPITMKAQEIAPSVRVELAPREWLLDPTEVFTEAEIRAKGGTDHARASLEHNRNTAIWNDRSALQYDWPELTGRLLALGPPEDTLAFDTLSPEQQVAFTGAERHLQLRAVAATEHRLRALMYQARESAGTDPQRMSEITGVSPRLVADWTTEGGNRPAL
jgi:hypothetical protein